MLGASLVGRAQNNMFDVYLVSVDGCILVWAAGWIIYIATTNTTCKVCESRIFVYMNRSVVELYTYIYCYVERQLDLEFFQINVDLFIAMTLCTRPSKNTCPL